jgi:AraC-like DNA-binding protein
MPPTLGGVDLAGLERSCANTIRFGPSAPGIERADVFLATCAFERHRHDDYAVGITTAGVQRFWYRGAQRTCLPGRLHVLHPDETHDGAPGTEEGFGYRILYIAPELVRSALGDAPLPFVAEPVQRAHAAFVELLRDIDEPVGELRRVEIATVVADTLRALAGIRLRAEPIDLAAAERVREYLREHAREHVSAATLETVAGLDRFTLARQFRRAYGTSPDRYRLLRRLALARAAIQVGRPLARAAAEAGFADQSHLTRQFKRAYGLTPGRWSSLQI